MFMEWFSYQKVYLMSRNIFVNSSILNCSGETANKFVHFCKNLLENPKLHIDDKGDVIIEEDFDRRHIKALMAFLDE